MPEISLYESERRYIDFAPYYGQDWSDETKRGLAVVSADITAAYFYVKVNASDASALISLSTADPAQIAWVNGKLRVKLGTQTQGHAGSGLSYELRLKMTDGSFVTLESGTFNIKESTVDAPV